MLKFIISIVATIYNKSLKRKVVLIPTSKYNRFNGGISVDSPQWCIKYKRKGWFQRWHTKRSLLIIGYDINPMHIDMFSDFDKAVEFAKNLTEEQIDDDIISDNKRLLKIAEMARKETVKLKNLKWEG